MNASIGPALDAIAGLLRALGGHAVLLAGGASAFLAVGAVALRMQRSPIQRQRLGELTVACTLAWLVLACVPLPRLSLAWISSPVPHATLERVAFRPVGTPALQPDAAELEAALRSVTRAPSAAGAEWVAGLSSVPQAAAARPAPRQWRPVVAGLYLAGSGVVAGWVALGHVLLARVLGRARRPEPWLAQLFTSIEADSCGRGRARLLVSHECGRPVSCGVFRPTVLLPAECARPGNRVQLRHVLLHELSHVRQRDAAGNALLNLAMPLLYAHPLYWLIRGDVRLARELVADDWAAARSGKSAYVADLVALARSRPPAAAGRLTAVGLFLFGSTTHFYRRMHMLIRRNETLATRCPNRWRLGTAAACSLALAAAVALAGARPAKAEPEPSGAPRADATPLRPVTPSVSAPEASASDAALDLKARLFQSLQRIQELRGQVRKAQEEDKSTEEQTYLAQLKRAEDDREQIQADLVKLSQIARDRDDDGSTPDRARDLKMLRDRDEQVALEKKELDEMTARVKAQQEHVAAVEKDLARKLDELKKREQQYFGDDALKAERGQSSTPGRRRGRSDSGAGDLAGSGAGSDEAFSAMGGLKLGAGTLDLVALATSYADAVGNVRVAEARVHAASERESPAEAVVEQKMLEAARRKAGLLRGIAEVAAGSAKTEYQRTSERVKVGAANQAELAGAEAKLQILSLILQSDSDSDSRGRGSNAQGGARK